MTIARIIATRDFDIISCTGETSVRDALVLLAEKRIGALPVLLDGQVAGIFSERDVIYCVNRDGPAALDLPVSAVMTAPAVTVDPSTDVLEALGLMTRRRIRHLPVVDSGGLKGFVSIGDLVKYRIERIEGEAAAMREYIQAV